MSSSRGKRQLEEVKVEAGKVEAVLHSLELRATSANRKRLARDGVDAHKVFGVSKQHVRAMAKRLGSDHQLALQLWSSGWHEARLVAVLIDEPARVTAAQMNSWASDFDSGAICDAACEQLFVRTEHAFSKVSLWANRKNELVRRAAFALLAALSTQIKDVGNEPFLEGLTLIERSASDERPLVQQAVRRALRAIAARNADLRTEVVSLRRRLKR